MATFVGGVTFALVTLPDRFSDRPVFNKAPAIMAVFAVMVGMLSVLYPQMVPVMVNIEGFTWSAQALNIIGGLGFVLAWLHFTLDKNIEDQLERKLLANHTLLFGGAALLFHFSTLWDATWWLWHILRLIAYLVILSFFLKIYFRTVDKIRENENRLKANQVELEKERSLIHGIIENSPSMITLKDPEGRYIMANTPFFNFLQLTPQEVVGHKPLEGIDSEIYAIDEKWDQQVFESKSSLQQEITIHFQGKQFTFLSSRFPLKNKAGKIFAIGAIHTDITKRKQMELNLELSKKIIDHTNEGIIVTDNEQKITQVNIAYSEMTGFSSQELVGKNPSFLQSGKHDETFYQSLWEELHRTDHWSGEIWDRKKDGSQFPQWLSITAIYGMDNEITHYVGIMHDITENKKMEARLQQLAYFDSLTQLPNRPLFKERLTHDIALCQRMQVNLALLLIDLDDFKLINDSLGHDAGDELLVHSGQRLKSIVRDSDTVARLGGDEFVIILSQINEVKSISEIAEKVIQSLKQPFIINDAAVNIGASIGISIYPNDGHDVESLMKNADLALYEAKGTGRNKFKFFSTELQQIVNENLELKQEISTAIKEMQFEVYYQPKMDIFKEKVIGMEALVRWNHPQKGLIPPDKFIPFAEQNGSIIQIGRQVLQQACLQTKKWQEQFDLPLQLAVNLSSRQFKGARLLEQIKEALQHSGLANEYLELEITESSVMDDVEEAIQIMHEIDKLNIKIAIDDFGTGYSSLGYLKRFPIHTVKIDRSFINDISSDADDRAIIESIILLSEKLHVEVVAEGVETPQQVDFLKTNNCHIAQGFLYSKPLNAQAFEEFLKANQ